jgi:hypothetical protein
MIRLTKHDFLILGEKQFVDFYKENLTTKFIVCINLLEFEIFVDLITPLKNSSFPRKHEKGSVIGNCDDDGDFLFFHESDNSWLHGNMESLDEFANEYEQKVRLVVDYGVDL